MNIAESSLAEVWYVLHAAQRLGYVSPGRFEELERRLKGVGAPLIGLIRATTGQEGREGRERQEGQEGTGT